MPPSTYACHSMHPKAVCPLPTPFIPFRQPPSVPEPCPAANLFASKSGLSGSDAIADVARNVQNDLMRPPPHRDEEPEWLQIQRRRRFNDAGREIWFSRILWSYMPAHWKGLAIPLGVIVISLSLGFLIDKDMSGLFIIPLLSGWALLMWICERHSPSRP